MEGGYGCGLTLGFSVYDVSCGPGGDESCYSAGPIDFSDECFSGGFWSSFDECSSVSLTLVRIVSGHRRVLAVLLLLVALVLPSYGRGSNAKAEGDVAVDDNSFLPQEPTAT